MCHTAPSDMFTSKCLPILIIKALPALGLWFLPVLQAVVLHGDEVRFIQAGLLEMMVETHYL